ncbi:MAG: methionyl-tRNA formyltransferase [Candidatus Zixiibacteriota bacterium]|nr:MAG: methionyl-tRNA formyltransferase [candidate division Zixibacteria bacterium]
MKRSKKILFIGSKILGLRCLMEMYNLNLNSIAGVLTVDDRDDGRSVFEEFEKFSSDKRISFYAARNKIEAEKIIKQVAPEMCFVVGWYWIIGKKTLESVPGGFLGIHHSLLPKYRGGSPLVWAMINGEKVVGTTLFSFAEGMDNGDIWAQEKVDVGDNDYISDMLAKLEEKAVSILKEKYISILEGKIKPVPQDHKKATFCAQRVPEDGMIDWTMSAVEIYNFIRAQSEPYPGAFTFFDDRKLIIRKAHMDDVVYYGTPGQVARRSEDFVYVICGDNRPVVLETVEYDGKKLSAGSTIKSIKTRFKNS